MTGTDKLAPFTFHGVTFNKTSGNEAQGDCPFCGKYNHLYVNQETGLWSCKKCGLDGNIQTFLHKIHADALASTKDADYKALAEFKEGIPWKKFKDEALATDNRFGKPRWLIPYYNKRLSLIGLRVFIPDDNKVLNTSGTPLALYGLQHLDQTGPIYVCEGEWDYLAFSSMFKRTKEKGSVLAVPGASVWKKEWIGSYFLNRDVRFLYDNDSAGIDGSAKAAFAIKGRASNVGVLHWPSELYDGFDVRDFIIQNKGLRDSALLKALNRMIDYGTSADESTEEYKPSLKRSSFASVLKDYKQRIHLDSNMQDGLALMYASILSIQIPGDPIWMFIVGPPGCGKSLILRSFERSAYAIFRSTLTPHSLISGYVPSSGDIEDDPSLIPHLTGKTLVIKDYTAVTSMSFSDQESLYGILRDAYDGRVEKSFGNGVHREYSDCHFAILAGVTDVIHNHNRAALGERFLKFQFVRDWEYDPTSHMLAAAGGMADQVESEDFLREVAAAYLDREITVEDLPKVPTAYLQKLISLCQIIAVLRTPVDNNEYRPRPEVGTRLVKQLLKLSQCLAYVLGKKTLDNKVYSIIENVAFDTVNGWSCDILRAVMKAYPYPALLTDLETQLGIHRSTLERRKEALELLSAVSTITISSQEIVRRGRPNTALIPTPSLITLWKNAGLPIKKGTPKWQQEETESKSSSVRKRSSRN